MQENVIGVRSMPVLGVKDVAASLNFYRDKLGFGEGGLWGPEDGPPGFAILRLGSITVALDRDPEAVPRRRGWIAYFYIEGVDAYHDALAAQGVEIVQPPHDAVYGLREFSIRDLDGHMLAFGQDLHPGEQGPGL